MSALPQALVSFVQSRFGELADPAKAGPMAAYMKTDMPFYGIQQPARRKVYRHFTREFVAADRHTYRACVEALHRLPHREEKYAAIEYASSFPQFVDARSLDLYERLIRQGAWWDLVDGVATHLVGPAYRHERAAVRPVLERWIDDDDRWIRRTALICQNGHKADTDAEQLFRFCLRRAAEKEFFIRKAIGWALREYSYTAPEAVHDFLLAHRNQLSGLSFREGSKQLVRAGYL